MISVQAVRLIVVAVLFPAMIALLRIYMNAAAEQRRRERLLDYLATIRRRNDGRI